MRLYVIEFLLNSRGNSWEDSEEDEDDFGDEEDDDWKPPAAYMKKGQRGSVSAEAYGAFNQKQADSCLWRAIVLHTNLCVCFVYRIWHAYIWQNHPLTCFHSYSSINSNIKCTNMVHGLQIIRL